MEMSSSFPVIALRHGRVRAAARIRSPAHAGLAMTESMAALRKFD
jgi:hypothetical protein